MAAPVRRVVARAVNLIHVDVEPAHHDGRLARTVLDIAQPVVVGQAAIERVRYGLRPDARRLAVRTAWAAPTMCPLKPAPNRLIHRKAGSLLLG